ncbi:MAG: ribbon-helix-helix protein, CopG family [Phycicoccus sp.]
MRTTVTIDDQLLRAARLMAATEHRTVSSVLEQALRDHLAQAADAETRRRTDFDLPAFDGALDVDLNDNRAAREAMERA